jgi:outer membrane cobalamin receptor
VLGQTGPFSARWQKGFFVRSSSPGAGAWHARRRHHRSRFIVALLGGGAVMCAPAAWPHDGGQAVDGGERDDVTAPDAARVSAPLPVVPERGCDRVYETVVTAEAPVAAAREDRAAASSVVTRDRTPRAAESVPELLSEQAGVVVTRLGGLGATATLSLRGSTANQVLVYLDGVPLNTPTGGGVDVGAIPLGDIDRIEIYRGTSPIGFGASAIGGVVSLTTVAPTRDRLALEVGGGSFGTAYGGLRAAWSHRRWHLYGSLRGLSSEGDFPYVNNEATNYRPGDDYRTTRHNNDVTQVDGMVRAALDLSPDRQLRLSIMLFDRDQGLPGQSTLTDVDARLHSTRANALLAYEANDLLGPGGRVRATAYGTYLLSRFADPHERINPSPTDTHDRTYTTGATGDAKATLAEWLSLAGVLDARYDRFVPSDGGSNGAPGTRWAGAAGVESDLWLRRLRLDVIASGRLEAVRDETSGRDQFYAFAPAAPPVRHLLPIVRLSLIETIAPWLSLRANGGRYGRMPSFVELYGNTGYLLGNHDLVPESGINADFGPTVSWRSPRIKLDASTALFASWVDDLISYRMGGGRARAENIASARIVGLETSASATLGRHARMFVSATLTDARDTTSRPSYEGKQLPLRPPYRLYARPEWRAVTVTPSVALGLYADADATAANFEDAPNVHRVESRLLFGAGLYASLPAGFCARLSARNLANTPVHDLSDYPLPGREVYLTLAWSSAQPQPED